MKKLSLVLLFLVYYAVPATYATDGDPGFWDRFEGDVKKPANVISAVPKALGKVVKDDDDVWHLFRLSTIASIMQRLVKFIATVFKNVGHAFKKLQGRKDSIIRDRFDIAGILDNLSGAIGGLGDIIEKLVAALRIGEGVKKIAGAVFKPVGKVVGAAGDVVGGAGDVVGGAGDVVGGLGAAVGDLGDGLHKKGGPLSKPVGKVVEVVGGVVDVAGGVVGVAGDGVKKLTGGIGKAVGDVGETLGLIGNS